jgi:hypothetical protein
MNNRSLPDSTTAQLREAAHNYSLYIIFKALPAYTSGCLFSLLQ